MREIAEMTGNQAVQGSFGTLGSSVYKCNYTALRIAPKLVFTLAVYVTPDSVMPV